MEHFIGRGIGFGTDVGRLLARAPVQQSAFKAVAGCAGRLEYRLAAFLVAFDSTGLGVDESIILILARAVGRGPPREFVIVVHLL